MGIDSGNRSVAYTHLTRKTTVRRKRTRYAKQKEEVKEYVKSFGLEIAQIYVQVEENTKEPMVLDSKMNLVDIHEVIEGIYLRDLINQ